MIRGLGAKVPEFKFNADDVTFNPYVAKRSSGVFAASPIVQGHWDGSGTPDVVSYPRGDQFGNPTADSYSNMDKYQGSVVFWITPEWDGNDGIRHRIWFPATAFRIEKSAANQLQFVVSGVASMTIDASGWTAGTTYCVVCRWDIKNTLDGTNYGCISVNGANTFGMTTAPDPDAAAALQHFGCISNAQGADALIEGFTVYRRPLFDDTYGVAATFDASGPIDEIAAIYAAGAGADPCLTTGSWDVVFALPTNASAGVLQTGTGHAWSHPHASNVLNHWTLEDALYAGGQWAVAFNGTTTSINCGSAAVLDDLGTGGAQFTVEAWMRCDASVAGAYTIVAKGDVGGTGWILRYQGGGELAFRVDLATTVVVATIANAPLDGKWHHVVGHYNDATKTGRLALDGVWGAADIGAGAWQSDAARNLFIGRRSDAASNYWPGATGWLRLSNNDRHTAGTDFIPPREFPGADGNTVEAWSLNDGTGGTAVAQVTSPGNDGTITAGTWEQQWDDVLTPVYPTSLEFDGAATIVNCGSAVALDDMHAGDFTAEIWVRPDSWLVASNEKIFSKTNDALGWFIGNHTDGIKGTIRYQGGDSVCTTASSVANAKVWHHLALVYSHSVDRRARFYIDGILTATGGVTAGAVDSDAALNLAIGARGSGTDYLNGGIGWSRVSNTIRYSATFVPPDRVNPPGADGNTIEQWDLQDGAGLTALAVVTTPGNDGTVVMGAGRWWNTSDMESESPGSRVYNWGEAVGSDAANDGRHQHLAGLTPGSNFVSRVPVRYETDLRAQPRIRVYDETNSATIVDFDGPWLTGQHDGGDDQSALADSLAPYWPYSLVTGVVWNITKGESATITAAGNSIVGTLSGGADWDDNDVYFIVPPNEWVWADTFTYELPTIARNGAAADCVEISFQRLNSAGEGVIYWQQVEVLENLIDNPSLETGAGNPWIPDGWTNSLLDAGDTQAEAAILHSGVGSMRWNAGAVSGEDIYLVADVGANNFAGVGGWAYDDGYMYALHNNRYIAQADGGPATFSLVQSGAVVWEHLVGVVRRGTNVGWIALRGESSIHYWDDIYLVVLDDVSLTVTPASEANSLETSGLRVDGTDQCTQTAYNGKNLNTVLGKSKWEIEFDITPRHDAADVTKFGTSSPDIAWFFGDANDYIFVDYSAASILRLAFQANGGGEQSGTWNPATMNAGTTYTVKLKGAANSKMELYVDGVLRITINQPCAWGTTPATASWGHHYAGGLSYDAAFDKP